MAESSSASAEKTESNYTAVLYFHGMGNQRRYEEVSRFVDALDKYAHNTRQKGILTKIRARLEPPRGMMEKDVSYIRVLHKNMQNREDAEGSVPLLQILLGIDHGRRTACRGCSQMALPSGIHAFPDGKQSLEGATAAPQGTNVGDIMMYYIK